MLTQEYLKSILHYDPITGIFTWLIRKQGIQINKPAGSYNGNNYHVIKIDYVQYNASILAWLYMTGEWPENEIDHEDTNPSNTRWDNLRISTRQQNNFNRNAPKNSTTKLKDVRKVRNKYIARLQLNGKKINLGTYLNMQQAKEAYDKAAQLYHGQFARK